jgi:GH15 family glucan-1,4-alpha-glucosidase
MNLHHQSIATILAHQHPGGAYLASPSFSTYAFSWLRDGSFIAHAMDRVGQHASAAAFHRWAGTVLRRHDAKLAALVARGRAGERIPLGEQMHTRFTVDGAESDAEWTNFQLDGYGTWLWALADHLRFTGDAALYAELRPGVARSTAGCAPSAPMILRWPTTRRPRSAPSCWSAAWSRGGSPSLSAAAWWTPA